MNSLTRNILDFYKINNEKNIYYLKKYFTKTKHLGRHEPNSEVVFSRFNGYDKDFIATVDDYNTYKINDYGFRGKNYENSDTIAFGCSITFGLGVPELTRWTNFLGNKINKNITNLGNEGASVETICNNIIQYCMNNKMPKQIFCLFPDFFRNMVVVDKDFYKSNIFFPITEHLELTFCNPQISKYNKDLIFMEIKDKSNIEDSISPHQLILDSINFIYIIESFCLTNGIKLYWTTWDVPSLMIMEEMVKIKDFKLKNFTPFYPNGYTICSSDHGFEFKNHPCWKRGSDYSIVKNKKTSDRSHPGIHFHAHVADLFYNLYNQNVIE